MFEIYVSNALFRHILKGVLLLDINCFLTSKIESNCIKYGFGTFSSMAAQAKTTLCIL